MSHKPKAVASDLSFTTRITGLSEQGFGVVQESPFPDKVFFVRGSWPGDYVRVSLEQNPQSTSSRYLFADMQELIEPSSDRITAPCSHHGHGAQDCNGCPWMMVRYEAQLLQKQRILQYALQRVGLISVDLSEIQAAPEIFGYRGRAQFKTDGRQIGYSNRHGSQLVPIQHCMVLSKAMQQHLRGLQKQLPNPSWQPTSPHPWVYIECDETSRLEDLQSNKRIPFAQANDPQNTWMQQWLRQQILAMAPQPQHFLELFCGDGNFTRILAETEPQSIHAFEISSAAISRLQAKHLPRVTAECRDLYRTKVWTHLRRRFANDVDCVVANPPRSGLGNVLHELQSFPKLSHLIYISCSVRSFARDAKKLRKQGIQLTQVQPLDTLPHTPHMEILAVFQR